MCSLDIINIDLTAKCNLRCRYCGFFADPAASGNADRSTVEWLKLIEEAGRKGVFEIRFRGGEPLTRSDFPELLDAVVANRMRFQLQTNALNFNEELARKISDCGRCNLIRVSLDGPREIHDAARGIGTHDRVVEAIGRLRKNSLPFRVTAAIHRGNAARLRQTADYLLRQLELPAVSFSGVVNAAAEEFILRPEEWVSSFETLAEIERQYAQKLSSSGMVGVLRSWRKIRDGQPSGRAFGECPRSRRILSIRNDGNYMLCSSLASTTLGRIDVDALGDVWERSECLSQLQNRDDSPANWTECRNCQWRNCCSGGCPASKNPETPGRPMRYCFKTFLDHGGNPDNL